MGREETVAAKVAQVNNEQTEVLQRALGESYDQGYQDAGTGVANPGEDTTPFDQSDIDGAVASATAPLLQRIQDMELAQEQKDQLEEGLADQLAAIQEGLRNLTQKSAPVQPEGGGEETGPSV